MNWWVPVGICTSVHVHVYMCVQAYSFCMEHVFIYMCLCTLNLAVRFATIKAKKKSNVLVPARFVKLGTVTLSSSSAYNSEEYPLENMYAACL